LPQLSSNPRISIMPRKCSSHPDTFFTCVVNWPFNLRCEIVPCSLTNVMCFILGVKWVVKIKFGPPH